MTIPKDSLFGDFEAVSSKKWKQQVQYELKGADYNENLVWESPEGIKVKPFYHFDEDTAKAAVSKNKHGFIICQDIFVFDVAKSAARALDTLSRGAESIRFIIQDKETDIEALTAALPFEKNHYYFTLAFLSETFLQRLDAIAAAQHTFFYCAVDPVAHLAQDGNWFPGGDNFEVLAKLAATLPHLALISADGTSYQNAGANITGQLAFTMAHLNEYFNRITVFNHPIQIRMAVGTNYFFEIAKIRAMRLLLERLAKEYGITNGFHIIAVPTKRNKTLYDYNVNMLRTTTECMSAILGGADVVTNLPYDALYHKSNEFGERIARNQLLILKEESYFDKVGNAAEGSYYIESLTAQLAAKALLLFKEIEAGGGFIKQLGNGNIQKKIAESAAREQDAFDAGTEILVGTNKFPNPKDRMKDDLELFPFVKTKPRKTLIVPIIGKRLAEKNEQDRLEKETQNEQI